MNCAELEILLCDYLDGTLAPEARAQVESHLSACAACAEMAKDVTAAVDFIGRAEEVQPPPELLTRILFELPSAHKARARKPRGLGRLRSWFQPMLQPRFAMGFAMTILSLSLIGKLVGISPEGLKPDDFRPTKVWQAIDDKIWRGWQRTVKFYENLRLVYEVQNQVSDWKQREREMRARAAQQQQAAPQPAPSAAGSGQGQTQKQGKQP